MLKLVLIWAVLMIVILVLRISFGLVRFLFRFIFRRNHTGLGLHLGTLPFWMFSYRNNNHMMMHHHNTQMMNNQMFHQMEHQQMMNDIHINHM